MFTQKGKKYTQVDMIECQSKICCDRKQNTVLADYRSKTLKKKKCNLFNSPISFFDYLTNRKNVTNNAKRMLNNQQD